MEVLAGVVPGKRIAGPSRTVPFLQVQVDVTVTAFPVQVPSQPQLDASPPPVKHNFRLRSNGRSTITSTSFSYVAFNVGTDGCFLPLWTWSHLWRPNFTAFIQLQIQPRPLCESDGPQGAPRTGPGAPIFIAPTLNLDILSNGRGAEGVVVVFACSWPSLVRRNGQ